MSEQHDPLGAIITKAWADDDFRRRLLADTQGTLIAEGVEIPAGFKVQAVENTDHLYHLVIPARPPAATDTADPARAGISLCACALLLDWTGLLQ